MSTKKTSKKTTAKKVAKAPVKAEIKKEPIVEQGEITPRVYGPGTKSNTTQENPDATPETQETPNTTPETT